MNQQERDLAKALAKLQPSVRKAFEQAVQDAARSVDLRELVRLIEAGQVNEAARLIQIPTASLSPLTEAMRIAYLTGGQLMEAVAPAGLTGVFRFNGQSPRALDWARNMSSTYIQGIQEDTLEMARRVIFSGLEDGIPSRTIGTSITGKTVGKVRVGGFLGLTAQQADSVVAGRRKLLSGQPSLMREYLKLKLRDKTFDARIKKAIEEGRVLQAKEVDSIIQAHRMKALGYRGRVIAGNETKEAMAVGRDEGAWQMLERPDVESVSVRWQHNLSLEPRLDHVGMNGTVIQLGDLFVFPDATLRYPHDPDAPAKHKIGCRCIGVYRVRLRRD